MTNYINGVPILSRQSFQEVRTCFQCGKDLSNSVMIHTIADGKEPFQEVEVCISCKHGEKPIIQLEKDDE